MWYKYCVFVCSLRLEESRSFFRRHITSLFCCVLYCYPVFLPVNHRDSTQAKLLLDGHMVGLNDTHRMYTRCISFFVHGNADMLVARQSMHKQASVSHVDDPKIRSGTVVS